jgi:hypothetical protein
MISLPYLSFLDQSMPIFLHCILTAHYRSAFQELGIRLRVVVSNDSEGSAEALA